jgi:hypothetical protein
VSAAGRDAAHDPIAEAVAKGFEPRDVPPRGVAYAVVGLIAGIAVSAALVGGLFVVLQRTEATPPAPPLEAAHPPPPPPRLEIAPATDRAAVEAAAQHLLQGYAWTDRAGGRARIPIERAMQILAAGGWPDTAKAKPQ